MPTDTEATIAASYASLAAEAIGLALRYGDNKTYRSDALSMAQRYLDRATVELNK